MNYMEREQTESDGIAKLILKHAGIIRQNIIVVIALTILGFAAGFFIQTLATDTFIKEVLLKNGNGSYLNVITNLIQPTSVLFDAEIKSTKSGVGDVADQENGAKNSTNFTIQNNEAKLLVFGKAPPEFKAVNLQIVLRAAKSKRNKIAAINTLPDNSRLKKKGNLGEVEMNKVIKRYKISSLRRGSDEIIIRFDGKSIEETEAAVNALVTNLFNQFSNLEHDRMNTVFKAKQLVINSQIKERENVLRNYVASSQTQPSAETFKRVIQNDILMIALKANSQKIIEFSIGNIEIKPFIVVPIDLSKKISFVTSKTWLFITALAGLIFGLFLCYVIYGLKQLRSIKQASL